MKRTRLRPISEKRRATFAARAECVRIVLARDGGCTFWRRVENYLTPWGVEPQDPPAPELRGSLPECDGPLDVHEPVHRSQGGDPTDPEQCTTVCRAHHDYAHSHPKFAKAIGL